MDEYDVQIGGLTHRLQLSPEDAERYGGLATKAADPAAKVADAPANKARGAQSKAAS